MSHSTIQTQQVIDFSADIITPLFKSERTMVMPFDIRRHENYGEHDAAIGLLAGAVAESIDQNLATGKIAEYALAHDIVRIYLGNVTVWDTDDTIHQSISDEEMAVERIRESFPMFPWVTDTYRDYQLRDTPEKQFVHALDKLFPHLLILTEDHHPVHPSWEAYKRTEDIARKQVEHCPALLPLFDELCGLFRSREHFFSTPIPSAERIKSISTEAALPTTKNILGLVEKVIYPLFAIERTMVMPFDLNRHENVGEHSLSLGIAASSLANKIDPSLDVGRIAEYALVHDIAEIHAGDISVWADEHELSQKAENESKAIKQIQDSFPMFPWITQRYQEYELQDTPEKRFVYALDKIYPHILVLIGNHHPVQPSWGSYAQSERVARKKIENSFPALLPLFNDLCGMFRQNPHFFSTAISKNEQGQTS